MHRDWRALVLNREQLEHIAEKIEENGRFPQNQKYENGETEKGSGKNAAQQIEPIATHDINYVGLSVATLL